MKMSSFGLLASVIGLSLSLPLSVLADDPPPIGECKVAVCDLDLMVDTLREKHEGDRFAFSQNLYQKYERTKDIATLHNLLVVGRTLRDLSIELKDEDYVIRSTQSLINTALVSLVKYDASDAGKLVERYQEIASDDDRFSVMQFWMDRLPKIEELRLLERLLTLSGEAVRLALPLDDTRYAYVLRQARAFNNRVTERIVDLDPYNEGVFEVELRYGNGREDHLRLCTIQAGNGNGLVVAITNPETNVPVYYFQSVSFTLDSLRMEGTSYFRNTPSRILLEFDRTSGKVRGVIRDTFNPQDIRISGQLTRSTSEFFHGLRSQKAPVPEEVEGIYEGTIAGIQGSLIVKRIAEREFGATFKSNSGNVSLYLQKGTLTASLGVLTLLSNGINDQNAGRIGFVLKRDRDSTLTIEGWGYQLRNGKIFDAILKRVADVDPYSDSSTL